MGRSILVSFMLGRLLGLGEKLALLVAVGNSICGNSAIVAVAPVIDADQRAGASAVGLTALIGLCLVIGLPFVIVPFALSNYQYGVLAGDERLCRPTSSRGCISGKPAKW